MNKVYAVADLHGMYTLWRNVLKELDDTDTLYILGDCGDRGPRGWDIIKEALADPRIIYIRGNHDQMLLDSWYSEWMDNGIWFWNGGYVTFEAILDDNGPDIYLHELAKTKLYHSYQNTQGQIIHLSHAGFTPPIHQEKFPSNQMLLWDREHFRDNWPDNKENEYVIHGHSYCSSKSAFGLIPIELNNSKTVGRYCDGHKICIDGRSFVYNKCALLDLDTLKEKIIESDAKEEILY